MKKIKQIITVVALAIFMLGSFSGNAQANPNNPYDSAGLQHNKVIKQFLEKYDSKNLSNQETLNILNNLCDENEIKGEKADMNFINFGIKDFKNNFRNVVNKSSLSKNGKLRFQGLLDYMITEGFKGEISYYQFFNYIIKFEDTIKNDKSITKKDMEFILKATSVARYSTFLWGNYYYDNMSLKSLNSKMTANDGMTTWWQWLIIGASDVAGGVAGGGAFSVSGAVGASGLANTLIKKK